MATIRDMDTDEAGRRMARGREAREAVLTAEEFATRFQASARALWTVAAGILGQRSEAEDVLQDAALMALAKLDRFEPGTNFLAWMGSFVRNVALNRRRKAVRRQTESFDPGSLDAHAAGERNGKHLTGVEGAPIDTRGALRLDQHDFDDRVLEALQSLGEVPRACLLLRAVTELGYRDIASLLAIPEGTAMSHVHRSRVFLRAKLTGASDPARSPGPEIRT
jgi:RNA polymerase sigma-70 factor (ECF subfamily)